MQFPAMVYRRRYNLLVQMPVRRIDIAPQYSITERNREVDLCQEHCSASRIQNERVDRIKTYVVVLARALHASVARLVERGVAVGVRA